MTIRVIVQKDIRWDLMEVREDGWDNDSYNCPWAQEMTDMRFPIMWSNFMVGGHLYNDDDNL